MDDKLKAAVEKHQQGLVGEAVAVYQEILKTDPKHPDALHYFGLAHMGAGKFEKAIDLIKLSLTYNPDNAKAWSNLGSAYQNSGQLNDAAEALERACILDPEFPAAQFNLGVVFQAQGSVDQAEAAYKKAIEMAPDNIDAISNLGGLYQNKQEFEQADQQFKKAISINPNHPVALTNSGISAYLDDRFEEAQALLDKAISNAPNFPNALYNRALVHEYFGEIDKALGLHKKAIQLKPDYADPHFNIGYQQLMRGDFAQGWKNYEWRLKRPSYIHQLKMDHLPRWGGQNLIDKTLLVFSEQGFGDSIQAVRFLSLVKARCPHVTLALQPALIRLFTPFCAKHGITLVANNGEIPATDFQIPMMSLPLALSIDESNIPSDTPYIEVDATSEDKWKMAFVPDVRRLNVGITWQGSATKQLDKGRSFPLAMYKKLAKANPQIRFVSLQVGPGESEIAEIKDELAVETYPLDDFADTAAIIKKLDLVIACDSSVAHLAGALGAQTWLVCKKRSEWRWMQNRSDSPWYPTMRIFRPKEDSWDRLFDDMGYVISGM